MVLRRLDLRVTQGTARDERIHGSPRAPDLAQRLRRRGEEEAGADARRSRPEGGRDRHIDVALSAGPPVKAMPSNCRGADFDLGYRVERRSAPRRTLVPLRHLSTSLNLRR
jgi:hypothetical protein